MELALETHDIYNKFLFEQFLNQVMSRRDEWRFGGRAWGNEHSDDLLSICSIEPQGESYYSFIMDEMRKSLREALIDVAFSLAKRVRNAPLLSRHTLTKRFYESFLAASVKQRRITISSRIVDDEQPIPMLGLGDPDDMTLYLFRENELFGVLPDEVHSLLLRQPGISKISYVSFSEKGAKSAILNARFLEGRCVNGLKIYSYQEFIEDEFGKDEWEKLSAVLRRAKEAAYYYCGLSVVKAVRPSSLRHFKSDVETDLIARIGSIDSLGSERELLDERFINKCAFKALTGSSDFAKSYMTAEWLYLSLNKSTCRNPLGNPSLVDLTPIVSSYFKAIEQFLYDFVSLHTHERDGKDRRLFICKGWSVLGPSKQYKGSVSPIKIDGNGYVKVTDELMSPAFKEKLTLNTLIGFLGSKRSNGSYRQSYNQDLFIDGAIAGGVCRRLIDTLESVKARRNGFFHKDNLYDWEVVDEIRDLITLAFYLLLGVIKINADEEVRLGFTSARVPTDDFSRLCDYIYEEKVHGVDNGLSEDGIVCIPVYYVNDDPAPYFAESDRNVTFNADGFPLHSAIILRELDPKSQKHVRLSRHNLPLVLRMGYLKIEGDGSHIELNLTERKTTIFKDEKFCESVGEEP